MRRPHAPTRAALVLCVALLAAPGRSAVPAPTPGEMAAARSWFESHLGAGTRAFPWSFTLDGRASAEIIARCRVERSSRALDKGRVEHVLRVTDPMSGLETRCVAVRYADFPVVEWVVRFRNRGGAPAPVLADALALDLRLERPSGAEYLLHHNAGSRDAPTDFRPLETPLRARYKLRIASVGGRPTSNELPFFNVEWPGGGAIVASGWPGQWAAEFERDESRGLRIRIGQETTRFRLHPGEEARTPLIALLFWEGDRLRSQNLWRRWMIAHNLPRPGGKMLGTHFASTYGRPIPTAEVDLAQIDGWAREKIPLAYWIIDAGWYPTPDDWVTTGTWEVDTERFPRGLREVADRTHANGAGFVVWFEPERVAPGTWLWTHHPEWLLGCPGEARMAPRRTPSRLLDLGNPEARRWLTDRVSGMVDEQGIDVYRQDFNMNPLEYWQAADGADRRGLTENAHVTGYLAYWDELLRRHPGLWIDTCASGGRRLDLETLRRSVPLLRSDWFRDATSQQCHTHGLSSWLPNYGSGCGLRDPYFMRSSFCPCFRIGCDMRNPKLDYALLRRTVAQFRRIEPYLLGDYYPLTAYSASEDVWMAWQFDRPETGGGCVQAFRRSASAEPSIRLCLHGLDPDATYAVTDIDDDARPRRITGRELTDPGLPVERVSRPASALFVYGKTD